MDELATELEILRANWRSVIEGDGGKCPCCNRWGKIYKRGINETMARSLIWLVNARANAHGWVDVPEIAPRWLVRSNQLPTLRWWDLVERIPSADPDNKHSGLWRPTDKGRQFYNQTIKVPQFVYTYDGEVEFFGGADVGIDECFGKKFSYADVMSSHATNPQTLLQVLHGTNP